MKKINLKKLKNDMKKNIHRMKMRLLSNMKMSNNKKLVDQIKMNIKCLDLNKLKPIKDMYIKIQESHQNN